MKKFGLSIMFFAVSSLLLGTGAIGSAYAVPGQGALYGIDGFNQVIFQINPVTGLPIAGTVNPINPAVFGSAPAMALDPMSGTMYIGVGGGVSDIYTINPATGAAVFHCEVLFGGDFVDNPGFPGAIMDMDFDSTGTLFAAVNPLAGPGSGGGTDLSTINLTPFINFFGNPECTHTEVPLSNNMAGIAFDLNDILFGTSTGGNGELFIINPGTGNAAPQGFIDQSPAPIPPILDTLSGGAAALQFDCGANPILYGGSAKGGNIGGGDLLSINPGNGFGTVITNPRTDVTGAPQTTTGNLLTSPFNFGFPNSLAALAFDQTCPSGAIGGELIPVNTAALLVAGAQSSVSWMVALAASVIGIGALVIKKKFI